MNITVTDQPQCKKQLRIEIPGDKVREETDKVAGELARQVRVPGFRPGHTPKSVIKTRFRKELRDEVMSHLLPHSLSDAIKEKDLKVIGEPTIDNLQFGDDESIDVTFTIDVQPDFELSNYKEIPIRKRVYKVTDEDVSKTIGRLRETQAEMVPVEDRGAQAGDTVTVNITGKVEVADEQAIAPASADESGEKPEREDSEAGEQTTQSESEEDKTQQGEANKPAEDIKQQDLEIEIGAQGVLKEFTEGLMGARAGDERSFTVEYPAEYKPEQYAGRRVSYTAEVTAVRVKELPEITDEFAQSIGEDFQTADELRAKIRSNLEHEAEHRTDNELRETVMEQLTNRNQFEVPEFIVEKQMDQRLNSLIRNFASQGIDPRKLNFDWDELRESQRERAERDVRASFILERISEAETIDVGDEEVDKEIEQIAASINQGAAAVKARLTKDGGLDSIKEQVKHRKALDLVIASADIKTEEVEGVSGGEAATGEGGQAEVEGEQQATSAFPLKDVDDQR